LVEALFMLLLVLFNSALLLWDNYKRVNELPDKIEKTMCQLKGRSEVNCLLSLHPLP
jgi:hypothetical protein